MFVKFCYFSILVSKFLASRTLKVDQYYSGASRLVDKVMVFIVNYKLQLLLLKAAEVVNVTRKTILVIGSQDPWLEAVLLSR